MNIEEIRKQAQDENATPETLIRLVTSEDKLTRQYIATNPNTPIEALEKIGLEFPESITANPVFDLLWLENPESKFLRLCLAKSLMTPLDTLERLTETEDIEILCAVASNPNSSDSILKKLTVLKVEDLKNKRDSFEIRYRIALNPNISLFLIEIIAKDRDEFVRHNLATNPCIPLPVIKTLAEDISLYVRRGAAINPNVTLEIIEKLAINDSSNLQREFINNSITPLWILQKSVESNLTVELKTELGKKTTFSEILVQLAKDNRVIVRRAVASNSNTPTLILEELLKDNYSCTHDALLNNPNSSNVLKETIRFIQDINKSDDKLITKLAHSKYIYIRKLVAKNTLTSTEILIQLATDTNIKIRKAILFRENLCSEIIDIILDTTVNIILNEQVSIKYSKESYILCLIAMNKNTANSTIKKLLLLLSNKLKNTPIHADRVRAAIAMSDNS